MAIPSVLISIAKSPMVAAVAVDAAKTASRTAARLLTQKGVDQMGEGPVRIVPPMRIRRPGQPSCGSRGRKRKPRSLLHRKLPRQRMPGECEPQCLYHRHERQDSHLFQTQPAN